MTCRSLRRLLHEVGHVLEHLAVLGVLLVEGVVGELGNEVGGEALVG